MLSSQNARQWQTPVKPTAHKALAHTGMPPGSRPELAGYFVPFPVSFPVRAQHLRNP